MQINYFVIPGITVTAAEVSEKAAKAFNLKNDICTRSREWAYVAARQTAMYYMYRILKMRVIDIARFFNREHGTVIHLLREVENRINYEKRFREEGYNCFIQLLQGRKW